MPLQPSTPVADELLQAVSGIDAGRVDIPSRIEAYLVQSGELAGLAPLRLEPAELFELVAPSAINT